MTRHASCQCGQLSVACEGEPVRRSICHCLDCQKRTGSAFGIQARFPRSAVRPSGRSAAFVRKGDSGGTATMRFCPDCGSTVYWEPKEMPDLIYVAVGAFANPTFPPPTVSVYGDRKHTWVMLPDSIEQLE